MHTKEQACPFDVCLMDADMNGAQRTHAVDEFRVVIGHIWLWIGVWCHERICVQLHLSRWSSHYMPAQSRQSVRPKLKWLVCARTS